MDDAEFQVRDKRAHVLVGEARRGMRDNPLEAICPFGIPKDVLLGMQFKVTNLDYVNNIIILALAE